MKTSNRFLLAILAVLFLATSAFPADQRFQATEKVVGANHPTLSDTINRLGLVEHNTDGTHKRVWIGTTAGLAPIHIKDSASGATPFFTNQGLILERSTNPVLQFLSTNTGHNYIQFGDPDSADVGHIVYKHQITHLGVPYNDVYELVVGGAGVLAFFQDKLMFAEKVGINLGDVYPTNPAAWLDVKGEGNTTATLAGQFKNSDGAVIAQFSDNGSILGIGGGVVPLTLGQAHAQVSHTGDTNEFTFATVTIPAGVMGASGTLRITTVWTYTSSANAKTLRVKLGGTAFSEATFTTTTIVQNLTMIRNRNNVASQMGFILAGAVPFGSTTAALVTGTVNTAVAQNLTITGQLASAGETINLESVIVELLRAN